MYLSSQLKSPHKTLKFQEKSEKNFTAICRPDMGPSRRATELNNQ